jgi:hypothetical protein
MRTFGRACLIAFTFSVLLSGQCALIVTGLPAILYADDSGNVNAQFSLSLPNITPACVTAATLRHPFVPDLQASTGYPLGAEITVSPVGAAVLTTTANRADYTLTIKKVWDTGQFAAKLMDQGQILQPFQVVRSRANFTIALGATPNSTIRSFASRVEVPLKNSDTVNYLVRWTLKVGDLACTPSGGENPKEIKASSSATLTCDLPLDRTEWFRSGFLKADTRNAVLTLESIAKPGMGAMALPPQPRKELPGSLSIAFYDEATQEAVNMVWLLIVLLAGGVTSLLLGAGVANTLRRVKIRNRLREVDTRTRRLPGRMDPELSVAMKVESRRIRELTTSQWWFSPDAADSLTQAETALARLEARAGVVAAMIPVLHTIHSPRGGGLPPSRIMMAEAKCHQAVQLLSRSGADDSDLTKAAGLVEESHLALDKNALKDDVFSQDILGRETALRSRLWDTTAQPAAVKSAFLAASKLWKAPFDGVLGATQDSVDPMEYVIRDLRAVRLALLSEYIAAANSGGPALADMITALQDNNWNGVRRAKILVAEALDGVTVDQIKQALENGEVEIVRSQDKPDALDSVTLSLCFLDANLNGAAARRKFCPQWKFGHSETGTQKPYGAEAWEVRHFFPVSKKKGEYEVEVSVPDITAPVPDITAPKGEKEAQPLLFQRKCRFTVEGRQGKPGRRFWLELGRTAALMVMGAVVLQKGAQTVLANSGIWTAALGILASGFTIDTLKSGIDGIRSKL